MPAPASFSPLKKAKKPAKNLWKPRYARIEANKLKKTLVEQGGELKEEARKAILDQLAKLEAAISKDEAKEETV